MKIIHFILFKAYSGSKGAWLTWSSISCSLVNCAFPSLCLFILLLLISSSFPVLCYHAPKTTEAVVAARGQPCHCGCLFHQRDSALLSLYTTGHLHSTRVRSFRSVTSDILTVPLNSEFAEHQHTQCIIVFDVMWKFAMINCGGT